MRETLFIAMSIVLLLAADSALAQAGYQDGKTVGDQFTKGAVKDFVNGVDPAKSIPGYQGTAIPEADLKNAKPSDLEAAAREKLSKTPGPAEHHEVGGFYDKAKTARPIYQIDPEKDPMFKRHKDIREKAHILSEQQTGCVDLPYGTNDVTKYKDDSCKVFGSREIENATCKKELKVSCANPNAGQAKPLEVSDFTSSGQPVSITKPGPDTFSFGNWWKGDCTFFTTEVKFYAATKEEITEFTILRVDYDDWLDVSLNGTLLYRGIGPHQGTNLNTSFKCEFNKIWHFEPRVNGLNYVRAGWNTIRLVNQVKKGGGYNAEIVIRRQHMCDFKQEEETVCVPALKSSSKLISSSCAIGPGTKYISGAFPYWAPCWEWAETYQYKADPVYQREPKCDQLVANGCGQVGSTCSQPGDGFCAVTEQKYSCPYLAPESTVSLCSNQLVCPDGNCTQEYKNRETKDATEDFKKAASSMAVADEVVKNFREDNIVLFKGRSMKCGVNQTASATNCCKDSGWAVDSDLAGCSTDEKTLGIAKESKQVHYVGSYSEGGPLDRQEKKVYCVYPSKISRIIIEYANAQTGKSYGSARNPDCSGIRMEDFEKLNLENIDLSELYDDVTAKAAPGTGKGPGDANVSIPDISKASDPRTNGRGG